MRDTDREARLEEIRAEVRQEVKRRLIPDEVHGGNYQGEITIAVLEEKVVGLLSEIDRLREIEEAASDAWREYDREMGLSEDVDAAIDYRELVTDDVDDAMWRLKAKLEGDHD